jgi:cysteine-rich repeat protein
LKQQVQYYLVGGAIVLTIFLWGIVSNSSVPVGQVYEYAGVQCIDETDWVALEFDVSSFAGDEVELSIEQGLCGASCGEVKVDDVCLDCAKHKLVEISYDTTFSFVSAHSDVSLPLTESIEGTHQLHFRNEQISFTPTIGDILFVVPSETSEILIKEGDETVLSMDLMEIFSTVVSAPTCTDLPLDPSCPFCGNSIVDSNEECDDGNIFNDDGCSSLCLTEFCGDRIVQSGEECDDGNSVDADGCMNNCFQQICGDGVVQAIEECDDGNSIDDDGCMNNCMQQICGDGVVQAGEECDDGNTYDDDACYTDCTENICGDGIRDYYGEDCDDGNLIIGDGCSDICALPPSYVFYASFDDTLQDAISGAVGSSNPSQLSFVNGKNGMGVSTEEMILYDYNNFVNPVLSSYTDYTVSFWFKPLTTNQDYEPIFYLEPRYRNYDFRLVKMENTDATVQFTYDGESIVRDLSSDWEQWHLFTFTHHNGIHSFMLDGEEILVKPSNSNGLFFPFLYFRIGGFGNGNPPQRIVFDELKMYDTPLSPSEIMEEYQK